MSSQSKFEDSSNFKQNAFTALEDFPHAKGISSVCVRVLVALIILNVFLVFIEADSILSEGLAPVLAIFSFISSICFGIEYFLRVWIADLVYTEVASRKARLRYMLSPMGLIDLFAFAPGLLLVAFPTFSSVLSVALIARLIRLIKLTRYMRGLRSLSRVMKTCRSEIVSAFMVLGLLMVAASVLMYEVENPVQPDKFDSVFTGMYWAMTTITTTGYGDLVPITNLGRLIGFVTMFLSIGVVAIPAGIFSAGFVAEYKNMPFRGDSSSRDIHDDVSKPEH